MQEWANPAFRKHIHIYPEVTGSVSEYWQAKKYISEVPDDQLTPMWANWTKGPHRHFYVKELARLRTGEAVVPLRWVVYKDEEHALAVYMREVQAGRYELQDPELQYIPCSRFWKNLLDLKSAGADPQIISKFFSHAL